MPYLSLWAVVRLIDNLNVGLDVGVMLCNSRFYRFYWSAGFILHRVHHQIKSDFD